MLDLTPHPKHHLEKAWIQLLRAEADKAALAGSLIPDTQLALFYQEQWFKALVPEAYGGFEWSLLKTVQFEEALAWAEGSAGWVFTLCSGAGWFGGYLSAALSAEIFKGPKVCLAGSGVAGGVGRFLRNGQVSIKGKWRYATGMAHATAFTANVYFPQEDKIHSVLLLKEEVDLSVSWEGIGLAGTSTGDMSTRSVEINPERLFRIDPDQPQVKSPLYRLPFGGLAAVKMAAN